MIWQSVVLNNARSDIEIAEAAARLFGIAPHDVLVVEDLSRIRGVLDASVKVICERASLPGRFPSQITFILRDADLVNLATRQDAVRFLSRFCESLETSCFLDDPEQHPYAAIFVPLGGEARRVLLDADRLDERGEYVALPQPATVTGT